ncbi:Succinate semialdehyde dehydrogenase (NAD(P)+) Sad [Cupriavidus taiwanensis]|uniref:Succinate semialdehyde dehydrogenase (NAD(P)+) Sad n=1 Tax=Cupriavidus taiwanensis TaxID=164546 RepID=A0A375HF53_9BURK|nr:NAD-dependent succinate-semialdehyde dehydrogenase [Cupriavidus taiwanensis]SOZ73158.1 Succinate semialdehyde dehydrogenase (NAD(P)+) Sad [Cupriavidus taiwanensis]SOZ73687.1 Succinate semialdehyde dehydrogenase (NAD(P)+) Sad [Cupriavidus taiwanensis]SOZ75288.1 Succinate semialdehyde dehydrogenase (NAD(P)+) Sad [Cupriavidus taiwanensis]SPA03770.1 Succinate semialdehyde dehydrogenase (NAD(P)+) Sad [Cupriavidus taiwanensis]SPA12595.1 Succinate semialdehyde dehydrogenase (NAD(P)+) Sad [Cupriavi
MTNIITTQNPCTGAVLQTYEGWTPEKIEAAVSAGHVAAKEWGKQPLATRVAAVRRLAEQLRSQAKTFAELVTAEMGKVGAEAAGEMEKSAVTAIYYADNAEQILADETVSIAGVNTWVSYEPIGMVLAVMPWNFPVWQVMRFAIPAITAGNGVLLKHSPNVTGCALALEKLFLDAGLPRNLVTTLVVAEPQVPQVIDSLIQDDRIAAVTLTGSNRAGAAVGAAAGRASKKSVLELGGSDAFIVLDDADLDAAVTAAVKARYHNAGQSCVCAKRFIVSQAIAEQFTDRFVAATKALVVGDPTSAATQMGPLARPDLRDALDQQVRRSVEAGATLLAGGKAIEGAGNFYEPTVLANMKPGMAAFDEETFGPLAAIAVAKDDADAVHLANATPFGLSVSVWSASNERALAVAKGVTSGAAFINAITASDARVPFGGTKKSGYGRELATAGIREFTNARTYWAAKSA